MKDSYSAFSSFVKSFGAEFATLFNGAFSLEKVSNISLNFFTTSGFICGFWISFSLLSFAFLSPFFPLFISFWVLATALVVVGFGFTFVFDTLLFCAVLFLVLLSVFVLVFVLLLF